MFFRSLRFRLTLWYTLALAVILTASGLFWHLHLSRQLHRHIDEKLLLIAEEVSAFHLAAHDGFPTLVTPEPDHCAELENHIRRHNWGAYVQVVSGRGSIACSSRNLVNFQLPLGKAALQSSAQGEPYFETVRSSLPVPLRVLTFPLSVSGRPTVLVQVGESLQPAEDTLRHLRLILWTFSPLAVVALSIGGWFLAGRALAPVVRISRTARRINAENLDERLPTMGAQDEIAQLAETFNSMLARLESSFQKVRQFTGDASHELRTPLAILKGETEVALRWAREPEELRATLESNLEEINRMGHILEDLLALAKSEAGELHLNIVDFSLSDTLQDLYLQGKILGAAKDIDVSLNLKVTEEIRIRGDQLQVTRMFLNLLTNAIKYTPEQGRVSISLAQQGKEAVVAVNDNGIGIPPEHLAHIFDRFYRVDEARNRLVGGSGLGLAIVKSIIDAHDGRIEVESAPERGSEFTVYLPLTGPRNHDSSGR